MAFLVAIFGFSLLGLLAVLVLLLRQRATRIDAPPAAHEPRAADHPAPLPDGEPPRTGRRRTISAAALGAGAQADPPPASDAPPSPLAAQGQQAIVLHRAFPPPVAATGRSHYGGVPLVGPGFVWPRHRETGRPLHFVLQVDLAQVPAPARLGLLPERGLLALFLDLERPGPHGFAFVWHDENEALHEAPLPPDIGPAYGDSAARVWPWALGADDGTPILPRWPFTPRAIALPARTGASDDGDPIGLAWRDDTATAQALAQAQGGGPAANPVTVADFAEMARPWAGFPRDWLSVQIAAALLVRKAQGLAANPPAWLYPGLSAGERAEEIARVSEEAQAWFDHARRNPAFARLDEAVRTAFWDWFAGHAAVTRLVAPAAFVAAIETGLHAAPETAQEVPATILDRLAWRHALAARLGETLHATVPNRMLAPPTVAQHAQAEPAATHLLLLELASDEAIGHHFGERALQFWITPQDLAAGAFDRVALTIAAT